MHESLQEFEVRLDPTTDCRVSCPRASGKKSPLTYNGENGVATFSQLFFDRILFILTGNDDIHKSLDEFKIRSDLITNYSVSCP